MLRNLLIAAFAFVASATANAGVYVAGGDFTANSDSVYQKLNKTTLSFEAWGLLDTVGSSFQCVGCELTFVVTGYTYLYTLGNTNYYSGGTLTVYLDTSPDFDDTSATTAAATAGADADTTVWLTLVGHEVSGVSFEGVLSAILTGYGLLDVTGGTAAEIFDTDGETDGADLSFATLFLKNTTSGNIVTSYGTSQISGNAIPEPASVALIGLGLLGFAGVARRRK